MTSIRIALCAALASLGVSTASAQPASTPPPEAKGQLTTQGFSVVLVLGDTKPGSSADDSVPPAARKALADMRDFLPYKSYRLLDTQWILGSERATTRLRGVDEQEYQLTLRASPPVAAKMRVTFQLQEPGAVESGAAEAMEYAQRKAQSAAETDRLRNLELDLAKMRERFGEKHPNTLKVEAQIAEAKRHVAAADGAVITRGRSVIDTSFSMDIGETVVVGTSRLRGGDKALIALLTAVPKK